jgi:hypothetical protein
MKFNTYLIQANSASQIFNMTMNEPLQEDSIIGLYKYTQLSSLSTT